MALIAKLLAHVGLSKIDSGGGKIRECEHFQPANTDTSPLPEDYVVAVRNQKAGALSAVGYLDSLPKKSNNGEHRIYSRSDSGELAAEIYLQNDGTILAETHGLTLTLRPDKSAQLTNGIGSIHLMANGDIDINGSIFKVGGIMQNNVITTGIITANAITSTSVQSQTLNSQTVSSPSISVGGKELAAHTHPAGDPPGNTGVNN